MRRQPQFSQPIKKTLLYPKSVTPNFSKIQYDPKKQLSDLNSKKYFAFGDSFVNMFLHVKNAFHIKLKGKSIKGLAKSDKQDRKGIEKWVKATKNSTELIFNFGQVDFNLIRYYKLVRNQAYPEDTFEEYVKWIKSLNRKSSVVAIFASPIKREHIVNVLLKYKTIEELQYDQTAILEEFEKTQSTRVRWNTLLRNSCVKYGIRFINLFQHNKEIPPTFLDQNPLTIHLRYLPCISELQKYITDLDIDFKKALEIQAEYVENKTKRYIDNLETLDNRERLQQEDMDEEQAIENGNMKKKPSENQNSGQLSTRQRVLQMDDFIDSLEIQGIRNAEQFFKRLFKSEDNEDIQGIADIVLQKGIKWANSSQRHQEFQLYTNLLKDIYDLKKDKNAATANISKNFSKHFISYLQKTFNQKIVGDNCFRDYSGIACVINFIIELSLAQQRMDFAIISSKIVPVITRQLVISTLKRLNSSDKIKIPKACTEYNCLAKLQSKLKKLMGDLYKKKLKKDKNFNQAEAVQKIQSILKGKSAERPTLIQKFLSEQNFDLMCCSKILNLILRQFDIEIQQKVCEIKGETIEQIRKKPEYKDSEQLINKVKALQEDLQKKRKVIEEKKKSFNPSTTIPIELIQQIEIPIQISNKVKVEQSGKLENAEKSQKSQKQDNEVKAEQLEKLEKSQKQDIK